MPRELSTALIAAVFYGVLLFWAVSWQRSSVEDAVAQALDKAEPGGNSSAALAIAKPPNPDATSPAPGSPPPAPAPVVLEPARFAAEQDADGRWEIDGQLAEQDAADAIRAALAADGAEVIGEIVVSPETETAPWAPTLASWLPRQLETVDALPGVAVIDGQVLIAGDVYSQAAADTLLTEAGQHFAGSGLELEGQFDVVKAPAAPEFVIAPDGNGGLRVAGTLREAGLKARVLELIAEVGDGVPVSDELAVSNGVAPATWASSILQVIPALVTEVTDLQLMASGGTFLMSGSVTADATKTALAEMTAQAFEGVTIRIDDQIVVAAVDAPASFSISRGEDGVLKLSGLLARQSDADQLLAAAKGQVSDQAQAPVSTIEVRQGVAPAPWVGSMVDLVAPFAAAVGWGALSVHGDEVAIEATVSDPENADVLIALVTNSFPDPAFKRVVEVSVATVEGPSDEDIAHLEKVIDETVIYFASASAKLSESDMGQIEEIAAALDAVPGSGIALLGNVDPVGNADYNEKLSLQRCEAISEALQSFGVEFLLIEIEEKGKAEPSSKRYKSGRRVEFELR